MDSEQFGSGSEPKLFTPRYISSGLPSSSVISLEPYAVAQEIPDDTTGTPSSTTINQDAPTLSTSPTTKETEAPIIPHDVEEEQHGNQNTQFDNDSFISIFTPEPSSEESSSRDVIRSNLHHANQTAIFINQSTYSLKMIKKYGMESSEPVDTLIVERSKLNEDPQGIPIDLTYYCCMVSSFMYLTSSRPDQEVNANCILMAILLQASTSVTQIDKAPVYDSNGSAKVQQYAKFYNNEIFNMFTQEERYTKLLEVTSEPHLVQQDDSNVIPVYSSMAPIGVIKVDKVNTVNREMKETNADLTTKLERISHDKAYNDMQNQIERVYAQLRDLKVQSMYTLGVSDTLDPLTQKLNDENVSL
uniref:Uncharacterized mitochondrial protein AtMg00810-like n=1 Tax=Tanacetum cinerariifolium TaxID=118510 RepID=A0A6L2NKS4_TANCI|nr:uncharacterized mitochondrial protein AtMg00810-like [Tanacetum cinerariifolium]